VFSSFYLTKVNIMQPRTFLRSLILFYKKPIAASRYGQSKERRLKATGKNAACGPAGVTPQRPRRGQERQETQAVGVVFSFSFKNSAEGLDWTAAQKGLQFTSACDYDTRSWVCGSDLKVDFIFMLCVKYVLPA